MALKKRESYDYLDIQQNKIQQPPELHVSTNKSGTKTEISGQILAAISLLAVLLVLLIYSNIKLTEIGDELSTKRKEYDILKSENHRMTVELEGKVSLRNIEESAVAAMGMAKAESYQIEYVNLSSGDKIEVLPTKFEPVISKVKSIINTFLAYIGI